MMDIQVNLGEIVDDERICCGGKRGCRKKKCCPMMIIGVVLSEIIGLLSLIVMNILFAINGYTAFLGLPVGDEMISFVRKSFLIFLPIEILYLLKCYNGVAWFLQMK